MNELFARIGITASEAVLAAIFLAFVIVFIWLRKYLSPQKMYKQKRIKFDRSETAAPLGPTGEKRYLNELGQIKAKGRASIPAYIRKALEFAEYLLQEGKVVPALNLLDKAWQYLKVDFSTIQKKDPAVVTALYTSLLEVLKQQKRYEAVTVLTAEMLRLTEMVVGRNYDYMKICAAQIKTFIDIGRYNQAEEACLKALDILRRLHAINDPLYISISLQLAEILASRNQFEDCSSILNECRALFRGKNTSSLAYAQFLKLSAIIENDNDNPSEAEALLRKALSTITDKGEEHQLLYRDIHRRLIGLLHSMGKHKDAIQVMEMLATQGEASATPESLEDSPIESKDLISKIKEVQQRDEEFQQVNNQSPMGAVSGIEDLAEFYGINEKDSKVFVDDPEFEESLLREVPKVEVVTTVTPPPVQQVIKQEVSVASVQEQPAPPVQIPPQQTSVKKEMVEDETSVEDKEILAALQQFDQEEIEERAALEKELGMSKTVLVNAENAPQAQQEAADEDGLTEEFAEEGADIGDLDKILFDMESLHRSAEEQVALEAAIENELRQSQKL